MSDMDRPTDGGPAGPNDGGNKHAHDRPNDPAAGTPVDEGARGADHVQALASRPPSAEARGRERRTELTVAASFGVTMLSGFALLALYALGGNPQLEGVLLALCLGALGVGIVIWAHDLMPVTILEEPRKRLGSDPTLVASFTDSLQDEAGFSRRTLLVRMLLGAFAGLGAALAVPVLSLGPAPGETLYRTPWRQGSRVVGTNGEPVRADSLPVGGVLTVFPEGHAGSADAQTLLVRVQPQLLELGPEASGWAPSGYVAYSKLCTHAGCPVGLYRAGTHQLVCPCHQSTFDVLRGAVPTAGPAARALPQLPIALQPDGTFVALGDFPEPVGPSFWNMGV